MAHSLFLEDGETSEDLDSAPSELRKLPLFSVFVAPPKLITPLSLLKGFFSSVFLPVVFTRLRFPMLGIFIRILPGLRERSAALVSERLGREPGLVGGVLERLLLRVGLVEAVLALTCGGDVVRKGLEPNAVSLSREDSEECFDKVGVPAVVPLLRSCGVGEVSRMGVALGQAGSGFAGAVGKVVTGTRSLLLAGIGGTGSGFLGIALSITVFG